MDLYSLSDRSLQALVWELDNAYVRVGLNERIKQQFVHIKVFIALNICLEQSCNGGCFFWLFTPVGGDNEWVIDSFTQPSVAIQKNWNTIDPLKIILIKN